MMLTRTIRMFAHRLIGRPVPESKLNVRYGKHLQTLGKWKVTTNGILFERNQFGECDYFMEEKHMTEIDFVQSELNRLYCGGWLNEMDCYHFVSAWYQKLLVHGKQSHGSEFLEYGTRTLLHKVSNWFVKIPVRFKR